MGCGSMLKAVSGTAVSARVVWPLMRRGTPGSLSSVLQPLLLCYSPVSIATPKRTTEDLNDRHWSPHRAHIRCRICDGDTHIHVSIRIERCLIDLEVICDGAVTQFQVVMVPFLDKGDV